MQATIFCDESGNFGDAAARASRHNVLGGVVVPDGKLAELKARWASCFSTLYELHDVAPPPHAVDLADSALAAFLEQAVQQVYEVRGAWIFVRAPSNAGDVPLLLYQRTLEAWVDLSARFVRARGATKLDAHVAQRTVPLADEARRRAEASETGIARWSDDEKLRVLVRPGIRATVASIEHEGGLGLEEIGSESASSPGAHPGLHMCDLGCAAVKSALHDDVDYPALWPAMRTDSLFVLNHADAIQLREIDRLAREDDLDLLRLCRTCSRLEARARGAVTGARLASASAARLAAIFRETAVARWATTERTDVQVAALLTRLAGSVFGALEAKDGDYEGTWNALAAAWAGDGDLAIRARRVVVDPEARVLLERLTLECANHRGDVAAADAAWERCRVVAADLQSLVGLGEAFRAFNVHHVALQNRLPAAEGVLADLRTELELEADQLERQARGVAELWSIVPELRTTAKAVVEPEPVASELALWRSFGRAPPRISRNREVGRALGSVARTWAFLGDHERAIELAIEARSRFGNEPFDLAFNSSVLVRILCDEARVAGGSPRSDALTLLLEMIGCAELAHVGNVVTALKTQPVLRFAIDALLRAMLWAPKVVPGPLMKAWVTEVTRGEDSSLYRVLARGLRSHPTELIARHAGELCNGAARAAWFELSIELCRETPAGSTLRRFAVFTERLRDGCPESGAPGGLFSPTFEYR